MSASVSPESSEFDPWFEMFCSRVSPLVWQRTTKARARRFHGGLRCWQAYDPLSRKARGSELCHECTGAHQSTLLALARKAWPTVESGRPLDQVAFARRNALGRFGDAVAKDEGAATGALQKVRRSVYQSKWIRRALADDPVDLALMLQLLYYLHGQDRPEEGSLYPLGRFAARLQAQTGMAFSRAEVQRRVDSMLVRLETVNRRWVERFVYSRTGHFVGVGGWEADAADDGPSREREPLAADGDEGRQRFQADCVLATAARLAAQGLGVEAALGSALVAAGHRDLVAALQARDDWALLVAEVGDRARHAA